MYLYNSPQIPHTNPQIVQIPQNIEQKYVDLGEFTISDAQIHLSP